MYMDDTAAFAMEDKPVGTLLIKLVNDKKYGYLKMSCYQNHDIEAQLLPHK